MVARHQLQLLSNYMQLCKRLECPSDPLHPLDPVNFGYL